MRIWFLLLCLKMIEGGGIQIPIYPSMLTPSEQYPALPNNVHASIQYGGDDKNRVISRHFHHNGYQYQMEEETSQDQKGVGIADVIHSMGALFHIVQSFPKLKNSLNQKHDLEEAKPIKNPFLPSPSFTFPDDDYGNSNVDIEDFPQTTVETFITTTSSDPDETTAFQSSPALEDDFAVSPTITPTFPLGVTSSTPTPSRTPQSTSTSRLPSQSTSSSTTSFSVHDSVALHNDQNPWTTLSQVDRHQCTYNDQVSFPCAGPDAKASFYKPTSVHRLRPGDIQMVAALGDSLVSAQGALSTGISNAGENYRGVSFATGGDEDWRTIFTIPNILREFNPRLIGTSMGGGRAGISGFNVAKSFALSKDLESQAEELISRIKRNVDADLREDWKLVMILIGQNDLCKLACIHNGTLPQLIGGNNRPQTAKEFARNIKKGLDVLMKGLPKSLVALILPPDPTLIMEAFHRPLVCHLSSKVICPCVDGPNNIGRSHMLKVIDEYHQALKELVEEEGYDKYNDFAVVVQPALKDLKLPKNFVTFFGVHKSFLPDLSYLGSDCFHPSQKLQALYAKNIWNNLLEPVGAKNNWKRYAALQCPTSERPFIATANNSDYDDDYDESEEEEPFQRKRVLRRRRKKKTKRSAFFDIINGSNGTCDLL